MSKQRKPLGRIVVEKLDDGQYRAYHVVAFDKGGVEAADVDHFVPKSISRVCKAFFADNVVYSPGHETGAWIRGAKSVVDGMINPVDLAHKRVHSFGGWVFSRDNEKRSLCTQLARGEMRVLYKGDKNERGDRKPARASS